MSIAEPRSDTGVESRAAPTVDLKLEVVVLPVSDVARAAAFYERLGWRKDADITADGRRTLQFTPPGSPCSVIFTSAVAPSANGAARFLHLAVSDLEAARAALSSRGAQVSEVFHDVAGGYNPFDPKARASGPDPERRSYLSFAAFDDPEGNNWLLQEITGRLPGRIDANTTSFASVQDLAGAMQRASVAHGKHEERIGGADPNWPDWYAAYMVAEQAGKELPL